MKHCPNPACPFLHQYKMVAEFRDDVENCPDCGTPLVPGEAPEIEPIEEALPAAPYQPLFPDNREPDLVTLCTVESEADAEFYKAQLELQGIPAIIVAPDEVAPDDEAAEDSAVAAEAVQDEATESDEEDNPDDAGLYEVQVLRSDLLRATHFLDTLETDETEEEDDEEEDEGDADENERAAKPAWTDPVDDDEPTPAAASIPVTPSVTRPATAEITEKTPSRSTQMLLILVLVVVVILIVLFLMNMFAK